MDKITAETLNSLLRAELSALETYRHVIENLRPRDEQSPLRAICEEHRESAQLLTAQISELGGDPAEEASTWKNIDILACSSDPLGDPIALKALIEGEQQDVLTYCGALSRQAMDEDSKYLIEKMLLPRTQAHISKLEELLCAA